MEQTLKIKKYDNIEEISLEEIVPENAAQNTQAVTAKEEPVDVEVIATWAVDTAVRTKGHPARDGWWLVYHPDDDDWYYLPQNKVKLVPKRRKFKELFKKKIH